MKKLSDEERVKLMQFKLQRQKSRLQAVRIRANEKKKGKKAL